MNYYKITNENEHHHGLSYKTGLNQDILPFSPYGHCTPGGIYFSREHILAYLSIGPWIREVTLPEDARVYEDEGELTKWKADKVMLGERRRINAEVIKELVAEGADDKLCPSIAFRTTRDTDLLKLLIDIFGKDMKYAASVPHRLWGYCFALLDARAIDEKLIDYTSTIRIAEVLISLGADVNYRCGEALKKSIARNNIDLVKMLIENGANCEVADALSVAIQYKREEIVKILTEGTAEG